jgi:hypothetical protein
VSKRGRPKTVSNDVHVTRYYFPDSKRDDSIRFKAMEERAYKAYEDIHMMAFDEPIKWFEINPVKRQISAILDRT